MEKRKLHSIHGRKMEKIKNRSKQKKVSGVQNKCYSGISHNSIYPEILAPQNTLAIA